MTGTQKRPVRRWTEAFRARNNRLAYDERRKPVSLLRRSERLLTSVRLTIYSGRLLCGTSHSVEVHGCGLLPTSWESKLDPDTSRRAGPLLHSEPRLSARARRSRAAGIGPVVAPRTERSSPAFGRLSRSPVRHENTRSLWMRRRAATVPLTVPRPCLSAADVTFGSVRRNSCHDPSCKDPWQRGRAGSHLFGPNLARPWQRRQSKRARHGDYDGYRRSFPSSVDVCCGAIDYAAGPRRLLQQAFSR
jgi:hypothetical protein